MLPPEERKLGWRVLKTRRVFNWLRYPGTDFAAFVYFCGFIVFTTTILLLGASIIFLVGKAFAGDTGSWSEAQKILIPTLIAILSSPFLIWRLVTGHWQAVAARKQADVAFTKQEIDRDNYASSAILTAIEMLGSTRERKHQIVPGEGISPVLVSETIPNVEARCGAIIALAELSKSNSKFSNLILQLLCAYIRDQSWFDIHGVAISPESEPSDPRIDIALAINAICRRSKREAEQQIAENVRIDFTGARLTKTTLIGCSLHNLTLWDSDLREMLIMRVDFHQCTIIKNKISKSHWQFVNFLDSRIRDLSLYDAGVESMSFKRCEIFGSPAREAADLSLVFDQCSFESVYFESYPQYLIGGRNSFVDCRYWTGTSYESVP